MRVTLSQDELFEAISEHLRGKLNLADSAAIEISFTAGRSPKGYTADVDITYPKSELSSKITAKPHEDEQTASDTTVQPATEAGVRSASEAATPAATNPAAAGVASADDLFNT